MAADLSSRSRHASTARLTVPGFFAASNPGAAPYMQFRALKGKPMQWGATFRPTRTRRSWRASTAYAGMEAALIYLSM